MYIATIKTPQSTLTKETPSREEAYKYVFKEIRYMMSNSMVLDMMDKEGMSDDQILDHILKTPADLLESDKLRNVYHIHASVESMIPDHIEPAENANTETLEQTEEEAKPEPNEIKPTEKEEESNKKPPPSKRKRKTKSKGDSPVKKMKESIDELEKVDTSTNEQDK